MNVWVIVAKTKNGFPWLSQVHRSSTQTKQMQRAFSIALGHTIHWVKAVNQNFFEFIRAVLRAFL